MALTSTHLRMNPLILSQPDFKEIDNNAAVHVPGMPRKRGRPRGAKSRNSSNRGAARGTGRGRGRGRGRGGSSIAAEASFQNVDEDVDMEGNDRPHPYNPIPAVSEQVEDLGELPTSAAIHLPPALSSTYKPMV